MLTTRQQRQTQQITALEALRLKEPHLSTEIDYAITQVKIFPYDPDYEWDATHPNDRRAMPVEIALILGG